MKMPFVGPFLESMIPNFDQYMAKWASGELSCVSVFHKSVLFKAREEDLSFPGNQSIAYETSC